MTQPRPQQIEFLSVNWSKTKYTTTSASTSDSITDSILEADSVTGINGGDPDNKVRGINTESGNLVKLRKSKDGSAALDSAGEPIFGRLTYSSGNYIVTYLKLSSGTEVSATLPSLITPDEFDMLFSETMEFGEIPIGSNVIDEGGFTLSSSGGTGGGLTPPTTSDDNKIAIADSEDLTYDFLRNNNIASDAEIEVSKLEASDDDDDVLYTRSGVTEWGPLPKSLNGPRDPEDDQLVAVGWEGNLIYRTLADEHIASDAEIDVSKLDPGNDGEVLFTMSGVPAWGSLPLSASLPRDPEDDQLVAVGWEGNLIYRTLANEHIAADAEIDVSKLDPSSNDGDVITTVSGAVAWASPSGGGEINVVDVTKATGNTISLSDWGSNTTATLRVTVTTNGPTLTLHSDCPDVPIIIRRKAGSSSTITINCDDANVRFRLEYRPSNSGTYDSSVTLFGQASASWILYPAGTTTVDRVYHIKSIDYLPAYTVLVNPANNAGYPGQSLAMGTNTVLNRASGDIQATTITNAHISASAAIAGSKITPDFGTQALTSGGITSSGTVNAVSLRSNNINCGATLAAEIKPENRGNNLGGSLYIGGGQNNSASQPSGDLYLYAGRNSNSSGPLGNIVYEYRKCIERKYLELETVTTGSPKTITINIPDDKRIEAEFKIWMYNTSDPGTDNFLLHAGGLMSKSSGTLTSLYGSNSTPQINGDGSNFDFSQDLSSGNLEMTLGLSGGATTTNASVIFSATIREFV